MCEDILSGCNEQNLCIYMVLLEDRNAGLVIDRYGRLIRSRLRLIGFIVRLEGKVIFLVSLRPTGPFSLSLSMLILALLFG